MSSFFSIFIFLFVSCASNPLSKPKAKIIKIDHTKDPEAAIFNKVAENYIESSKDLLLNDSYILQIFSALPNAKFPNKHSFLLARLSETSDTLNEAPFSVYYSDQESALEHSPFYLNDFRFWMSSETQAQITDIDTKSHGAQNPVVYTKSISLEQMSSETTKFSLKSLSDATAFKKIKKSLAPENSMRTYYCKIFKKSGYLCHLEKGFPDSFDSRNPGSATKYFKSDS